MCVMTTCRALAPFAALRDGHRLIVALLRAWARSAMDACTLAYALFYWAWAWRYERDAVLFGQEAPPAPPQWSPLRGQWTVGEIWDGKTNT